MTTHQFAPVNLSKKYQKKNKKPPLRKPKGGLYQLILPSSRRNEQTASSSQLTGK